MTERDKSRGVFRNDDFDQSLGEPEDPYIASMRSSWGAKEVKHSQKQKTTNEEIGANASTTTKKSPSASVSVAQRPRLSEKKSVSQVAKMTIVAGISSVLLLGALIYLNGRITSNPDEDQTGSALADEGEKAESVTVQGYVDGVEVSVSYQNFPDGYEKNNTTLRAFAETLTDKNAVKEYITSKGFVYVATIASTKQTVILAFDERLVFITSDRILSSQDWIEFIDNLELG